MRIAIAAKIFAFLLLSVWSAPANEHWIRFTSPHFEVYTNASEAAGRQVLARFEQVRDVFRKLSGTSRELPLPVQVYVFASEADFRPYRPSSSSLAFYQSGPERDYIAMQYAGVEAYRVVFHEYTHLVLNHSSVAFPKWMDEGTAELYSTLEIKGNRVRVGSPVAGHLRTLAHSSWLTAAALSEGSSESTDPAKVSIFYAQSWALVHMLNFSREYLRGLSGYTALLKRNTPSAIAFHEAFGRTLEQAIQDLHAYVEARRFDTIEMAVPAGETFAVKVSPMPQEQARMACAELLLRLGHDTEARKLYAQLARDNPGSVEAEVGLATLALHQRQDQEARAHLERALAAGSPTASLYFEYAMLLRDSGAPRAQVDKYLYKTVALDPNFAEAQFLIGVRESDDGHYGKAVDHLRVAAGILPRQAYFWHALAFAYYKLGQKDAAREGALRALNAAANEQERQMAEAALLLTEPHIVQPRATRPAVSTPKSWQNRVGDARVEGILVAVDCIDTTARLHVHTVTREVALLVKDPKRVVLKNASSPSMQITCGPQAGRHVAIDYIAATGEVTAIEFQPSQPAARKAVP
ncbi:MAG TPA: hypothetical protein VKV15_12840 [Bryobacteraceae bacterium]|nr:hypothetical protein [Bryobacteraceae bacterium]